MIVFEFYFDESIGQTHVEKHSVTEKEIYEFFFESLYFEYERKDGSFIVIGKLKSDRFLQIAYRKKSKDNYYIITAYDLLDQSLIKQYEDLAGEEK